eukprot:13379464-Heterocapsa_arctica.AAC.1
MDKHFNHHIVDEAQSSFGDQQLLCGRVKEPSGLTTHIGDKEQARCPAVQDIGPQHLYCIEKAFSGGLYHPSLGEAIPVTRAALVDVA